MEPRLHLKLGRTAIEINQPPRLGSYRPNPPRYSLSVVDDIEPRDRRVRPDINLCQPLSIPDDEFPPILQDLLQLVQSLEQFGDGLGVRLDLGREPRTVDAIVDLRVDPFVELVDLFLEVGRVEVELGLFPRELLVEGLYERKIETGCGFSVRSSRSPWRNKFGPTYRIEEPDDLAALVRDDRVVLGIPDDGDYATRATIFLQPRWSSTANVKVNLPVNLALYSTPHKTTHRTISYHHHPVLQTMDSPGSALK